MPKAGCVLLWATGHLTAANLANRRMTVPLDGSATSATMERLMRDDADVPFCELPRVNPAVKVCLNRPAPLSIKGPADPWLALPFCGGHLEG
jgi:hypothetical protein